MLVTKTKGENETILSWMRKMELHAYAHNENRERIETYNRPYSSTRNAKQKRREQKKLKEKEKPKKGTLDAFIKSKREKSVIFDDGFGPADFRLLTLRWLEENANAI